MESKNESSAVGVNNSTAQQNEAQSQIDQTKAKVEEVVDIMRLNVERIVERGTNLTDLDQRSDALNQSAIQFQIDSNKLQRKHWFANVKMRIALAVVVIGVIIIIVVWSVYG